MRRVLASNVFVLDVATGYQTSTYHIHLPILSTLFTVFPKTHPKIPRCIKRPDVLGQLAARWSRGDEYIAPTAATEATSGHFVSNARALLCTQAAVSVPDSPRQSQTVEIDEKDAGAK
jgi:hypothetical protein